MLTITDEYLFLYCQLLANNPDFDLSFEQLISHCDDDMGIIFSFKEFLSDEYKKQSLFIKDRFDESDKKKH